MVPHGAERPNRSDAELLAAHVDGDRYAFGELVGRHQRRLHRLARLTSPCREDAADALQDALLSAHRHAGSFRYDAEVSSWLHRIVVNACLDRLRSNRFPATAVLDGDAVVAPDRTAQVDTALVVRHALMRLPTAQRAAVVAVDMHGYSVAEAARVLGVAEGTIKSRRARARSRLAVLLGQLRADGAARCRLGLAH